MPRYIDADLLTETMRNRYDEICDTYGYHDLYASGYDDAVDAVENAPTADVAPRAEVAREIFEEIEREITDALKSNYKVLPQVEESEALWNNVNGKINALRGIRYFIDELKKKYTGGEE